MGVEPQDGAFTEGWVLIGTHNKSFFIDYLSLSLIILQSAKEKKMICAIE